jgi:hypothetical protein
VLILGALWGFLSWVRDEFVPDDIQTRYQLRDLLPDWGLERWITLSLFLLLVVFIEAGYQIGKQRQKEIDQTKKDRLKCFEERTSPKLRFLLEDCPPYKNLEDSTPDGKIWRFRVHVQNTWHEQLTDCAVILEGISPIVGVVGEKFIPRRLKLASDNPPNVLNEPHRQSFPLAPIDGKELIDICQVDMRPGANRTRIFIATEGHRDLSQELYIPNGNYTFALKAEAHIGKSWGESFVLETNHTEPKFFRLSTQPALGTQDSSIPAT